MYILLNVTYPASDSNNVINKTKQNIYYTKNIFNMYSSYIFYL